MRTGMLPYRPRVSLASSALLILIALAFGAPAAAGDIKYEGWYGNLDLALTQPNSLDQNFANHIDRGGAVIRSERLVMDNDADIDWKLDIGYSWGRKGRLQVSYWEFDNDDAESGNKMGELDPMFVSYSGFYGQYLIDDVTGVDFEASTSVDASTLDLDYIRPITSGERFRVDWLAGLRVANFEETNEFFGEETYNGAAYAQEKHFESDGLGFRVGATAVFAFTPRFSMEGGAIFSFLQADSKGDARLSDDTGATLAETLRAEDDNIRGEIRDYGLRAVWDLGPVDVYAGYRVSDWSGLVTDPFAGGGLYPNASNQRSRDDISFNSWNIGARWQIQPRK